jgi:nicotinamide mononucleotide adenylyltransferase
MDATKSQQFYFFIGRTTPPHFGHISAITQSIVLARASHTCALILLGNGPSGGMRTNENPVEHETKAAFITHKLRELGYVEGTDFTIQMMRNPPNRQVVNFVSERITGNVSQISIFQVAGNKDNDIKKHDFVRASTCNELVAKFGDSQKTFNCGFVSVDPAIGVTAAESGSAMSATKVRNKAVECYDTSDGDSDKAFRLWLEEFPFYNEDVETRRLSREIFDQIILYKDKLPPKPNSKTSRVRPEDSARDDPSFVKTSSAKSKRDASPGSVVSTKRRNVGRSGAGGGGSRRKRTQCHNRKLRNKKTLRNNR